MKNMLKIKELLEQKKGFTGIPNFGINSVSNLKSIIIGMQSLRNSSPTNSNSVSTLFDIASSITSCSCNSHVQSGCTCMSVCCNTNCRCQGRSAIYLYSCGDKNCGHNSYSCTCEAACACHSVNVFS